MTERETLEELLELRELLAKKEAVILRQDPELRFLEAKVEGLNRNLALLEATLGWANMTNHRKLS